MARGWHTSPAHALAKQPNSLPLAPAQTTETVTDIVENDYCQYYRASSILLLQFCLLQTGDNNGTSHFFFARASAKGAGRIVRGGRPVLAPVYHVFGIRA